MAGATGSNAASGASGTAGATGSSPAGAATGTTPAAPAGTPGAPAAPGGASPAPTGNTGNTGASNAASGNQAAVRFDPGAVPGWSLLTPQEQQAYSDGMSGATTVAQCRSNHQAYLAQMQARARSLGQPLDTQADPCAAMQRQGGAQR